MTDPVHVLTAIAITEAHQSDDTSDRERLLGWYDDPDAREVISALAELVLLAGKLLTNDPHAITDVLETSRIATLHQEGVLNPVPSPRWFASTDPEESQ